MATSRLAARRALLRLLGGTLGATLFAGAASAQSDYPNRPVRFVTWSSPGGTIDVVTRLMADALSKAWKQPVTVDNRTGAAGMLATEHVARSPADGYTLLFTTPTAQIYNPLLRKTTYDPFKDFQPLSLLVTGPIALTAPRNAPYSTMRELIEQFRGKPKGISYGTWGVGSGAHLLGEQLRVQGKVDTLQVPYKNGETGILVDLVGGSLDVGFMGGGTAKAHADSGKLKILAVTGDKRARLFPNVPTFAEQGLQGMQFGGWIGAYAPAGTPRPVVDKIVAALKEALAQPEIAAKLGELTYDIVGSTPEQFAAFNQTEFQQWGSLIKARNITVE